MNTGNVDNIENHHFTPDDSTRTIDINFLAQNKQKIMPRWRKPLISAAIIVILFFLTSIVYGFLPSKSTDNPLDYDPLTLEPKPPEGLLRRLGHFVFSKDISLAGERDDRVNILLLGIGGEGHDGPYLSDTMMIVSLKPSTKDVAMISIPRDLEVEIPDHGTQKINAANAFGELKKPNWGAAFATKIVEDTFDVDINYYIRVDFRAFERIIDSIGGIKVFVDRSFSDPMYPAPNSAYKTVSFARGVQSMDGKTALLFARSRHGSNGEGSDFARSRRQQKVLLAVKEKILSASTLMNPMRIKNIIDELDSHITSNMEFGEMLELARMGRDINKDRIISLVLDTGESGYLDAGTSSDGAFVLVPKTGNFNEINQAIKDIFQTQIAQKNDTPKQNDAPNAQPANSSETRIEIQNGTWRAGLAARIKKRLEDNSFEVQSIGNTSARPMYASAIYVNSKNEAKAVSYALKNELNIQIFNTGIPAEITHASTTDILIVLGEDIKE